MDKPQLPVPYAGMTRIRFKGSSRWFESPRPRRHLSLQTEAPLGTATPVLDKMATPRQEHDAAFCNKIRPKGAPRPSGPAADRLSDHGYPLRRRRAGIAAPGLSPGRSCLLSWLDDDNLRDRSAAGAAVVIPGAVARCRLPNGVVLRNGPANSPSLRNSGAGNASAAQPSIILFKRRRKAFKRMKP